MLLPSRLVILKLLGSVVSTVYGALGYFEAPSKDMHLANLQHDDHALRVEVHGCDETFANMLRRSLTDVAIPATTRVTVRKNTSAFPNEALAHRLGLLPLRSKFAEHRPATLKATGPCVVRADRIQADDVEVAAPHVLVVCLADGEELDVTLHIELKTGKDHARHNAAVAPRAVRRHAGMQHHPTTGAVVPLAERLPVECFCPTTEWGAERCAECAGRKRTLAQKHAPLVFVLEFETTGALRPLDLLRRAMEHAEDATTHVAQQLRGVVAAA